MGVIFDMDGVLIDSYEPHRISWQDMAGEYGVRMTDEEFAQTFGRTSHDIILDFWGRDITDGQVRRMDDRKEQIFRELLRDHLPIMDGAARLIDDLLASGFKVGIGSSGPPENVNLVVEELKLATRLSGRTTGADVTRGKPDPQVFLRTAEKMQLDPACCLVVEDAIHGITAAKRAGMKAIGLTGTATREALSQADLVVDSLTELTAARVAAILSAAPGQG